LICDQTAWQQQIDALSDIAVCTCADYGSLDSLSAMAEAVLRTAPERFSIAGHSMGGRIALQVYRLAPDRIARIALSTLDHRHWRRARPALKKPVSEENWWRSRNRKGCARCSNNGCLQ
jgi:pimeloyl-ACP methyl ester carboxylesterase